MLWTMVDLGLMVCWLVFIAGWFGSMHYNTKYIVLKFKDFDDIPNRV
jgi:hypothetical protein